jgi:hypothetical protein
MTTNDKLAELAAFEVMPLLDALIDCDPDAAERIIERYLGRLALRKRLAAKKARAALEAEAKLAEPVALPSAEEIECTIGYRLPAYSLNLLLNLMRSYAAPAAPAPKRWVSTLEQALHAAHALTSEAAAPAAPAEPVAWGMRDKTTGLILDVICPDEHDSHAGDYTIPLYVAPCWTPEQVAKTQEIAAELKAKVKVKPEAAPAAPAPHPDTKDADRYRRICQSDWADRAHNDCSTYAEWKAMRDARLDAAIEASKGGAA